MISKLLLRNLALTGALVVAAAIAGSLFGLIVAHLTYPASMPPGGSGMTFGGQQGAILRAGLRESITSFFCWAALILAQVVFLAEHLRPEPPLAKPVEQA